MTFWLEEANVDRTPPSAVGGEGTFGETLEAGWTSEAIDTDRDGLFLRTRTDVLEEMLDQLPDAPEPTGIGGMLRGVYEATTPLTGQSRRTLAVTDPKVQEDLFRRAGLAAARDPGKWGNLPLTPEQVEAEVERRLRGQFDEAATVLGRGGIVPEFLGRGAAAMSDPISLLMMPFGGGGRTFSQIAFRGGLAGAAGEAAILPNMYYMAEKLDLPDPSPFLQVGMGAVFGAGLNVVPTAVQRGHAYVRGRQLAREETPPGVEADEAEAAVRNAEAALNAGQEPPAAPQADPVDASMRLIMGKEGFRPNAYWDVNAWRTGFGTDTVTRADGTVERVTRDTVVTREDALRDLERRTREFQAGIVGDIGQDRWDAFAPNQKAALTSIAYNYGSLPDRLVRAIEAGDEAEIAIAINRLGGDNDGINAARRAEEARIFAGAADVGVPDIDYRTRAGTTRSNQVTTPTGRRVEVEYEVVDASLLRAASGDLQPRDRSRATSDEQIAEIAARLDPPRLMPGPEADRGAPVVGPDDIIESGNGRVQAILRAAEMHPDRYDAYRAQIEAAGFEIPEGIERPVLVARRRGELSPEDRQAFVREANTSSIARMSATEQAGSDAAALSPDTLAAYRSEATPFAPANAPFLRALLARLPRNERAAMIGADKALNTDGIRRVEQMIFARAFGDSELVKTVAETGSREMRSLLEALQDAAPAWARMRALVEAGEISAEFDVTPQLVQAVRIVGRARRETGEGGVRPRIDRMLDEVDLVDGAPDPLVRGFIDVLYTGERARNAADVADILKTYADEAVKIGDAAGGLLGAAYSVQGRQVIDGAIRAFGDRRSAAAGARDAGEGAADGRSPAGAGGDGADEPGLGLPRPEPRAEPRADPGPDAAAPALARFDDGAQSEGARLTDEALEAELRAAVEARKAAPVPEAPETPDAATAPAPGRSGDVEGEPDADGYSANDLAATEAAIREGLALEYTDAEEVTWSGIAELEDLDTQLAALDVVEACNPKGGR